MWKHPLRGEKKTLKKIYKKHYIYASADTTTMAAYQLSVTGFGQFHTTGPFYNNHIIL